MEHCQTTSHLYPFKVISQLFHGDGERTNVHELEVRVKRRRANRNSSGATSLWFGGGIAEPLSGVVLVQLADI
jgi:hypothetical protein